MVNIIGFDGKTHKFNFSKYRARSQRAGKSSHHSLARELIKEVFPLYSLYEEVTLPGSKKPARKSLLYADFFIPDLSIIVEVHGKQHYEFCSFFHKSRMDFLLSQKRDRDKVEWCELNDIKMITLPYNKEKEWRQMLEKYMD